MIDGEQQLFAAQNTNEDVMLLKTELTALQSEWKAKRESCALVNEKKLP